MAKARVRGVYSTALTKFLLDHGFDIVQPSISVQERFGLKASDESPDFDIYDRPDRQGVHALGKVEPLHAFISILRSLLDDVITRRWKVAPDGIYKGLIKSLDPETRSVLVDIGPAKGEIASEEISDPEQRQIVVQVEGKKPGTQEPLLTTKIRIPGKYAILIPDHRIKFSRKIQDWQTRSRLYKLGEELAQQKWGILWRTAASSQTVDVLKKEIASLAKEGAAIMKKAERTEGPAPLWEEKRFVDMEFPALSKKRLDEARGTVTPTMDGHHFYKACGVRVSSALDMAEKLLERGSPTEEVEVLFEQTVGREYPTEGSLIKIEHVKLDGNVFNLGTAQVEAFDGDEPLIRFRRIIKGEGTYDGLKTRKEAGDYAITEAKVGEWHFETRYFSMDGQFKGAYINLNTPIELYPYGIRYVDLEVDICLWPSGKVQKLDEEKLEEAVKEGIITEKLAEIVKEKAQSLMKNLSHRIKNKSERNNN